MDAKEKRVEAIIDRLVYEALTAQTAQGAQFVKERAVAALKELVMGCVSKPTKMVRTGEYDEGWANGHDAACENTRSNLEEVFR